MNQFEEYVHMCVNIRDSVDCTEWTNQPTC